MKVRQLESFGQIPLVNVCKCVIYFKWLYYYYYYHYYYYYTPLYSNIIINGALKHVVAGKYN